MAAPKFSIAVSGFIKKTDEKIIKLHKRVFTKMFSKIVRRSPVKTGLFRGNWQVGFGKRPTSRRRRLDKDGQAAIAEATAKINSYRPGRGKRLYIANNLPYARALEYGHSRKQAPNGMMRITVAEFQDIVRLTAHGLHKE